MRTKNKFASPGPTHNRQLLCNVRVRESLPGGVELSQIAEIQLHLAPIASWDKESRAHEHYEYFRTYFSGGDRASVEKRMALLDKLGFVDSVETFVRDAMEDEGESITVAWLTFGRTLVFKGNADLPPAHTHVCSSVRMR